MAKERSEASTGTLRFMNDAAFQKIVTGWMASEAYRRFRAARPGDGPSEFARALPRGLRLVVPKPGPDERYVTCVPLVPLKAAAGAFGQPQLVEDDTWEWVAVETRRRLRPGMFVAQVVGHSMEPKIPDGSYCLFAPVSGTRQGKTILVQLHDRSDPETGQRYTR